MKWLISLFIAFLVVFCISAPVVEGQSESINSTSYSEMANGFLTDIYSQSGLDAFVNYTSSKSFIEMFGYSSPFEFIKDIFSGKLNISLNDVWNAIKGSVGSQFRGLITLIVQVVVLAALCGLLQNVNSQYLSPRINDTAFYTIYMALGTILIMTYFNSLNECISVFGSLIDFMNIAVPIFIVLLTFSGGIVSSSLMSPALLFLTNVITYVVRSAIIPMTSMLLILQFVSHLLSEIDISYLTSFVKKGTSFFLGGALTVFTAAVTLEGITFASVDGVAVQAIKFAASNLIPVIGSFLSSSYDTINGFALVIKNSVGLLSMLIIASIIALPIIKLFLVFLALKAAAIIVQPFAEKRFSAFVDEASGCVLFVDLCVLAVGALFIIMTAMFVVIGNYLVMMR